MIGQENLLNKIEKLASGSFPRFTLIVGPKGSGKKLVCREIANKLKCPLVPIGTGVEEVREVIVNSYRNTEPIVYVVPDTDKMSVAAKNALLKITEEPPQKAYFILTVTDLSNMLKTLISRACVLKMDNYTGKELKEYLYLKHNKTSLTEGTSNFILNVCTVPEEVDMLMSYDVDEFMTFTHTVAKNLHTVSSANAFKIEQKLALKKDEDKWDVLLFLQALKECFFNLFMEEQDIYFYNVYKLTCKTIIELKVKNSANKQYCLDAFILDARKCWREQ